MEFEVVAREAEGVAFIPPERARVLYEHVRSTRPSEVLDLGTARGGSAAYIAAALEANGHGRVTTVDSSHSDFRYPTPTEFLARLGLSEHVSLNRSFSTYNWFLKEKIRERSDTAGNCEPIYDLCFLDGGKNWTVEGLAVFLLEKLLRPGGWLLMDDLGWTYAHDCRFEQHYDIELPRLSNVELVEPHLREVFELIIMQHPSFTDFRIQDNYWGWARKMPGEKRRLSLELSRPLTAVLYTGLKEAMRPARRRYHKEGSR